MKVQNIKLLCGVCLLIALVFFMPKCLQKLHERRARIENDGHVLYFLPQWSLYAKMSVLSKDNIIIAFDADSCSLSDNTKPLKSFDHITEHNKGEHIWHIKKGATDTLLVENNDSFSASLSHLQGKSISTVENEYLTYLWIFENEQYQPYYQGFYIGYNEKKYNLYPIAGFDIIEINRSGMR